MGYTNAGKSTLFNRLTRAEVLADDLLFATLDPTMRAIGLPSGRAAILSDTVGFISDLPTGLIAAFRATLEEVVEAEVVVHIRDASHADTEAQKADVLSVLRDLAIDVDGEIPFVEVLNKIDLMDDEQRALVVNRAFRRNDTVVLSALTGEGCDVLLDMLEVNSAGARRIVELSVALTDGAAIAWLYQHGQVIDRRDDETICASCRKTRYGQSLTVRAPMGSRKPGGSPLTTGLVPTIDGPCLAVHAQPPQILRKRARPVTDRFDASDIVG